MMPKRSQQKNSNKTDWQRDQEFEDLEGSRILATVPEHSGAERFILTERKKLPEVREKQPNYHQK